MLRLNGRNGYLSDEAEYRTRTEPANSAVKSSRLSRHVYRIYIQIESERVRINWQDVVLKVPQYHIVDSTILLLVEIIIIIIIIS